MLRGRYSLILALVATFGLGGCASERMMSVTQPVALSQPQPDKATVVFLRTSMLGAAIQSSVFDVTDGDPKLIGIVSSSKKVAHLSPPGRHRFMSVGENADFLDADLDAGKTYHVRVSPRMGLWKARFVLEPIPPTDSDLAGDLAGCGWVENTPSSIEWAVSNRPSILSKKADYLADWEKSADKLMLKASDGR